MPGTGTSTEKLMLRLAYVAYFGVTKHRAPLVRRAVEKGLRRYAPEQSLIWGPVVHSPGLCLATDAMMFAVRHGDVETVVIRGTNPASAWTWLAQDFNFAHPVPWKSISPATTAGPEVKVSRGAQITMSLLQGLVPEPAIQGAGVPLLDYLRIRQDAGATAFNFTGHSLGGLAASSLALWASEELGHGPKYRVFSFAGPTAGNEAFVELSAAVVDPANVSCFRNRRDFVPSAWDADGLRHTADLYQQAGKAPDIPILDLLLYDTLEPFGYAQLARDKTVCSWLTPLMPVLLEVGWQHLGPYAVDLLGAKEGLQIALDVTTAFAGLRALRA